MEDIKLRTANNLIIVKLMESDIVKLKAQKRRVRAFKLFLTCRVQSESNDLGSKDCKPGL